MREDGVPAKDALSEASKRLRGQFCRGSPEAIQKSVKQFKQLIESGHGDLYLPRRESSLFAETPPPNLSNVKTD